MMDTPRFRSTRRALAPLLAAGVLALAGCAGLQPQTTEQLVQQRAQQRWDALLAGDFAKAWTYTPASYRARVKQDDYRDQFGRGGRWTAATVKSVDTASAKAAKGLVVPAKWPTLGASEAALWGECQGSGSKPYQVQIDPSEPAFRCTCPSRKFPCKHGLALMLL